MHRFVAFLRGINVGGRVVVKERLKEAFISLGFQNVSTYKQSGNIAFEGDSSDPKEVAAKIENKLQMILGYEIVVFVRTFPQLKKIIDLTPFKDQISEGSSFLVTFLPAASNKFPLQLPLTIPKSTAQIILSKDTEVFSVTHGGGEGALPNSFLEAKLKTKTTTRNMNTIKGIFEKFS
jgi:uncharacterized protein (DUF1697 family)